MVQIKRFHLENLHLKVLVYWDPGTGKTSFGATAPNPFWLSAEGWLASVIDTDPVGIEINSLKDLKDALIYLQQKQYEKDQIIVETVIIDSVTEINEIIKDSIKDRSWWRELAGKDWGKIQDEIRTILRRFRDLPLNVIFVCHSKEIKDEDKTTKIVPLLNWQSAIGIAWYMDIVAHMSINKLTGEYEITTKWDAILLTKDRLWKFPATLEPHFWVWQTYIKDINTQSSQVIQEYEIEESEWASDKNPLPSIWQIKKRATSQSCSEIVKLWNDMWSLLIELDPEALDAKWEKKHTQEKCEPTRKATMRSLVGIDSTIWLTQEQADILIEKFSAKCSELSTRKATKKNETKKRSALSTREATKKNETKKSSAKRAPKKEESLEKNISPKE